MHQAPEGGGCGTSRGLPPAEGLSFRAVDPLHTVSKGSPHEGAPWPPPLQPLGAGNAGRTGTRLVGLSKQMVRLTGEACL